MDNNWNNSTCALTSCSQIKNCCIKIWVIDGRFFFQGITIVVPFY